MKGIKRKCHDGHGPFHTFVVTSPDSEAAKAALMGPLKRSNLPFDQKEEEEDNEHNYPLIISTSDPFDTRVGSGGGTLQALSEADKQSNHNQDHNGSVCIIHAGGQSSRCPTQMVLGKAWTSLPIVHENETVSNPTYILMQSLSTLLQHLPCGSVVVAASDVILHLPETPIQFDQVPHDKVLGLAVPAPLHTAKNHGVFCISSLDNVPLLSIQSVDRFLQKPTCDEMEQTMGCTFYDNNNNNNGEKMALVDTGVVIFLPQAAKALRQMMKEELMGCTSSGIEYLYNQYVVSDECTPTSCSDYAKQCAIKMELYSHILLAIPTRSSLKLSSNQRLETYLSNPSVKGIDENVLKKIYNRMSHFELQVLFAKEGRFTHLGTTAELCQFLIDGAKPSLTDTRHAHDSSFSLTNRACTFVQNLSGGKDSVIMNSLIHPQHHLQMGERVVLEYCHISNDKFTIGSNCVISGWRGPWTNVYIPNDSLFQMMPLKKDKGDTSFTTNYVCIFQGIHDDIKSRSTFFGVSFDEVFRRTLLEPTDIWTEDSNTQMLWNARLHPVVEIGESFIDWDVFSWILPLIRGKSFDDVTIVHLQKWKKMKRLSLSEIQARADTCLEFSYRSNLAQKISNHLSFTLKSIQDIFQERRRVEIHLDFALDSIRAFSNKAHNRTMDETLSVFEDLILFNVQTKSNYDICCRLFMVLSALINNVASVLSDGESKEQATRTFKPNILPLINTSNEEEDYHKRFRDYFKAFRSRIRDFPGSFDFKGCAKDLEEVAHAFTTLCTSTQIHLMSTLSHERLPPLDSWTVVTAPGRVDLAGGWSDTPPISYEFGGAVTNIAVIVNGIKPISVRCRRVYDLSEIILRTENRDMKTGNLNESNSVIVSKLGDLADYANPSGKCSLLKCALFAVGLVLPSMVQRDPSKSVRDFFQKCLLVEKDGTKFGLELVSTSLLPHGSGLGTSSILAACVLASLGTTIGLKEANDPHWLVKKVLLMEQLHSTGGGWQDQVGGILPGVKLCTSQINQYPVDVSIESFTMPQSTIDGLNDRMVLGFTGKPRLAKNILQNVLRRWALRKEEIVTTVESLVCGANDAFKAVQAADLELLGKLVNEYWEQKCVMAGGEGSGVEPEEVRKLLDFSKKSHLIEGGTLCGAGGGGFIFLLLKENVNLKQLIETIKLNELNDSCNDFTWYPCQVSKEGLSSFMSTLDDFDLLWHYPTQKNEQ